MLQLRDSKNVEVSERSREALALVGYVRPVRGRGVNVLCLDGGGTKYVVFICLLRIVKFIYSVAFPFHGTSDLVASSYIDLMISITAQNSSVIDVRCMTVMHVIWSVFGIFVNKKPTIRWD